MSDKDYYEILGVPKDASDDDIKKAYRTLARKYHPDLHPGDKAMEARFKGINEAYSVIGDPKKRSDYDLTGRSPFGAGMGGGGYRPGGGPMGGMGDFGFGGGGGGGFEDIFSEIFGGQARRRGPARGADIEYSLKVDFLGSVKGVELKIKVKRRVGTSSTVNVKIPPGIVDGSRVRLAGKGDSGTEGGPPGDLYIVTKVRPHPYLRRVGNDIHLDVPVTIKEAVTGGKVEVPTIDDYTTIKVPAGTQGGQKLRIKGKGVYPSTGAPRGHQYVIIKVVVPKKVNRRSKELLDEFSEINDFEPRDGLW